MRAVPAPGPFSGRGQAQQALRAALAWGLAAPARLLQAWDDNFIEWPWSDAGLLAALPAWAGAGRSLQLLARQYDDLVRHHPRFVRWRRDYAHVVGARALEPDVGLQGAPQALLLIQAPDAQLTLRLLDRRLWRGDISLAAAEHRCGQEWFDAVAQRSHDAFAPTTLGL